MTQLAFFKMEKLVVEQTFELAASVVGFACDNNDNRSRAWVWRALYEQVLLGGDMQTKMMLSVVVGLQSNPTAHHKSNSTKGAAPKVEHRQQRVKGLIC